MVLLPRDNPPPSVAAAVSGPRPHHRGATRCPAGRQASVGDAGGGMSGLGPGVAGGWTGPSAAGLQPPPVLSLPQAAAGAPPALGEVAPSRRFRE